MLPSFWSVADDAEDDSSCCGSFSCRNLLRYTAMWCDEGNDGISLDVIAPVPAPAAVSDDVVVVSSAV